MLWLILIALSVAGGHLLEALFFAIIALSKQRPGRLIVTIRQAEPSPPATPYDHAVLRQQARKLHLIQGEKR